MGTAGPPGHSRGPGTARGHPSPPSEKGPARLPHAPSASGPSTVPPAWPGPRPLHRAVTRSPLPRQCRAGPAARVGLTNEFGEPQLPVPPLPTAPQHRLHGHRRAQGLTLPSSRAQSRVHKSGLPGALRLDPGARAPLGARLMACLSAGSPSLELEALGYSWGPKACSPRQSGPEPHPQAPAAPTPRVPRTAVPPTPGARRAGFRASHRDGRGFGGSHRFVHRHPRGFGGSSSGLWGAASGSPRPRTSPGPLRWPWSPATGRWGIEQRFSAERVLGRGRRKGAGHRGPVPGGGPVAACTRWARHSRVRPTVPGLWLSLPGSGPVRSHGAVRGEGACFAGVGARVKEED